MIPFFFVPSAITAILELVGTVVVTTVAARVASDIYDVATDRCDSAASGRPSGSTEVAK